MSDTKPCPACGSKMILRDTGTQTLSIPAHHLRMWWCGCGHRGPGPDRVGRSPEDLARWEWERLNTPGPSRCPICNRLPVYRRVTFALKPGAGEDWSQPPPPVIELTCCAEHTWQGAYPGDLTQPFPAPEAMRGE